MKIGIIGGGILGVTAGYYLSRQGHEVLVFEREPAVGGLGGSFTAPGNVALEQYHHFFSPADSYLIDLLNQFDLDSEIKWADTRLGNFRNGALHPFTSLLDMMRFPYLDFLEKARFLWSIFTLHRVNRWEKLDVLSAREWIIRRAGLRVYENIWQHLFESKFDGFVHTIPTAWFWARTKRRAKSRNVFSTTEKFGYFPNSISVLFEALTRAIQRNGGAVLTNSPVERIVISKNRVKGLVAAGKQIDCDCVLMTIPVPHLKTLAPEYTQLLPEKIRQLEYAAILNLIIELPRQFSPYFWMNICDTNIPYPGIIEFTNLRPAESAGNRHFIYIPNYLPRTHALYGLDKDALLKRYLPSLKSINNNFSEKDILNTYLFKEDFADPYYFLNYASAIPPFKSSIDGLFLANTSQIYPWTRSINNGINYAQQAAAAICDKVNG